MSLHTEYVIDYDRSDPSGSRFSILNLINIFYLNQLFSAQEVEKDKLDSKRFYQKDFLVY